jgi:hypothetical protein
MKCGVEVMPLEIRLKFYFLNTYNWKYKYSRCTNLWVGKLIVTQLVNNFPDVNRTWVVSIKQNINFNIQPPSILIFLVFTKIFLLQVIPFKMYQHADCWLAVYFTTLFFSN